MLKSLFNKVAGLQTYTFIKKRLQHKCFPVKFEKLLSTSFFNRTTPVAASLLDPFIAIKYAHIRLNIVENLKGGVV